MVSVGSRLLLAHDLGGNNAYSSPTGKQSTELVIAQPQTKRGRHYGMVVPDKITIFQKPIEAKARSDKQIEAEIQRVVRHEIAHHFGTDEETLRRLEGGKLRRRQKETTA